MAFSPFRMLSKVFVLNSSYMKWFSHLGHQSMKLNTSNEMRLVPFTSMKEQVRTNIRKHFYRPSERLRVKKHGYETRLKTPSGRAILMRRILKGRFVLSHWHAIQLSGCTLIIIVLLQINLCPHVDSTVKR